MIFITGGGTGGHLAVAQAIKESLNENGVKPIFVGSENGQDRAWFAKDFGFEDRIFLPTKGVMNRNIFGKIAGIFTVIRLVFRMRRILRMRDAKVVFSVGGYSAAPAAIAAVTLKIPLVIHEQNAVSGTLNTLMKPFAKRFYSSFDPDSESKDYPIKREFFDKARVRERIKAVIFLGGSQGAKAINDFALSVAPTLAAKKIKIIHQCGKGGLAECRAFYEANKIEADLFDFDLNISDRVAEADLAVARSGAGTLFELAANGLPALFIPYPYAMGNHQMANAKYLCQRELGWCIEQSRLSVEALDNILPLDLSFISEALAKEIRVGGADFIAEKLYAIKKGRLP
ncbi:MAG: UDP-N-acetylglucosamine--N-acetylmuramyl-(pentapeptide) pyrophosphoryl-undecaprenol N-acetylglucosamine transferase [Helicobacteraceae bacterium]|jgi:UDP-N-acetylglucosamine--N-acetylmuramyl-(pentapeptide) pyrophosphoryl-undecaprenol N-acetylglucosamine transferase|nr:UDP-N-acetylglucosamine--N-acetylmuramyl-(pentapeptide) pyrophosphoryl-undecaprenol N-acetylglucosamine transferase [Helicobacteraceae bacterium]